MKKRAILIIGLAIGINAYAQIVKGRSDLPVYDLTTGGVLNTASYREVCLGDTPVLMIYGARTDQMLLSPIGVLPWPADKPNPCKGMRK